MTELFENLEELPEPTKAERLAYLQGLAMGLEYAFDLAKATHEAVSEVAGNERRNAILGTLAIYAEGIQRAHGRVRTQFEAIEGGDDGS